MGKLYVLLLIDGVTDRNGWHTRDRTHSCVNNSCESERPLQMTVCLTKKAVWFMELVLHEILETYLRSQKSQNGKYKLFCKHRGNCLCQPTFLWETILYVT